MVAPPPPTGSTTSSSYVPMASLLPSTVLLHETPPCQRRCYRNFTDVVEMIYFVALATPLVAPRDPACSFGRVLEA
jgi:hypothetical protein